MPGKIDFTYDKENDIIIAHPVWNIATIEDCITWYKQWDDYMSKFQRKMDVIIELKDFNVESSISLEWGEYRARLNINYFRFSYRLNNNLNTGIYTRSSGIRYFVAYDEAKDIESAYEAIKEDRRKAGVM
jgi:hypothetical protein